MSKQTEAVQRLRKLSDDLDDVAMQLDVLHGPSYGGQVGFGREVKYTGRQPIKVLALSTYGGVMLECIDGMTLRSRSLYTPHGEKVRLHCQRARSSDLTVPKLAQLVAGKVIERPDEAGTFLNVSPEEIDFVIDFVRDRSNNLLLSRHSLRSVGETLHELRDTPHGDIILPNMRPR